MDARRGGTKNKESNRLIMVRKPNRAKRVGQVAMILDDEPLTNHAAHTFWQSKASVAAFP